MTVKVKLLATKQLITINNGDCNVLKLVIDIILKVHKLILHRDCIILYSLHQQFLHCFLTLNQFCPVLMVLEQMKKPF